MAKERGRRKAGTTPPMAAGLSRQSTRLTVGTAHGMPLVVQIAPPEKQSRSLTRGQRVVGGLVVTLLAIWLLLTVFYLRSRPPVADDSLSGVRLTYTAPEYATIDDENAIAVTVVNTEPVSPITATVTLVFTDTTGLVAAAA
ncbi:MAG: hypothetical protein HY784_13200, partial [Chloroflexi bacterium]|nr:hypothetical protein [Chloroflexota bacterium]